MAQNEVQFNLNTFNSPRPRECPARHLHLSLQQILREQMVTRPDVPDDIGRRRNEKDSCTCCVLHHWVPTCAWECVSWGRNYAERPCHTLDSCMAWCQCGSRGVSWGWISGWKSVHKWGICVVSLPCGESYARPVFGTDRNPCHIRCTWMASPSSECIYGLWDGLVFERPCDICRTCKDAHQCVFARESIDCTI